MSSELPDDAADRRQLASRLRADAVSAMSVTRDQEIEITSARQLQIWEEAATRILALDADDAELNAEATAMLEQARTARRWSWINQLAATLLAALAVAIGVGSAILGGLTSNLTIGIAGTIVGSALLATVVLMYRRENWRIRADRIAPLIWKPGV
jgi:hypothetical protein